MPGFEVFNMTLWKIVMAINEAEAMSCSLQLVRAYDQQDLFGAYENKSRFLDESVNMMIAHGMPIMVIDYTYGIEDQNFKLNFAPPTGGVPLKIE